jgi:hypothetical protein
VRAEIGSEFHWDPALLTGDGADWLPERHELFATGCGALAAVLRAIRPRGRLHVPSYFCMGVAEALSQEVPIAWYRHLPDGHGPRWRTLAARPGDVVLAQNLFGRDEGGRWSAWQRAHPDVVLVEDHSHDPFSGWARASDAPYAIASLRKTLPVPDGGLAWSPRGLAVPRPAGPESAGAHLKLAGMLLKAAWRAGRPVPKAEFRQLQQRGEQMLLGCDGPASALTAAVLPLLDVAGVQQRSGDSARALAVALPAHTASWRVLGAGPFRMQLVCPSEPVRDALLAHLAGHGIFAPVHWRQDRTGLWSGDEEAARLADRMLTVPVDHRCSPADVRRIADVLLAFEAGARPAPVPPRPAGLGLGAQRRAAPGPAPAA